jgi:pimeloyl-ACP methyl ester carboxylesterase
VLINHRERRQLANRLAGALERSETPIGLICGAGDPITGGKLMRVWRERLPQAPVFELDSGAGYSPPLECPHDVVNAYRPFRNTLSWAADGIHARMSVRP